MPAHEYDDTQGREWRSPVRETHVEPDITPELIALLAVGPSNLIGLK